jgi:hypothetical protein
MSQLRGRYVGNPETAFDFDSRQIESQGLVPYTSAVIDAELPDSFWTTLLAATLQMGPGPGGGTRISCRVPCPPPAESPAH